MGGPIIRTMRSPAPGLKLTLVASAIVAVGSSIDLPDARGDVFHMKTGEPVEADILEDLGESYRLRTLIGIVDVEKNRIERIEKKTSPWKRYRAKRKRCPQTAHGHFALAEWCRDRGLGGERLDELEAVLAIDPDHAAAREALGYIQTKRGKWVKKPSPRKPTAQQIEARRQAREEEQLARKLISQWFVKVKAIHKGRLVAKKTSRRADKFRKGRELILAIRDPLAIPAITGVLSAGDLDARLLLVEALAQFAGDEATMNLVVMAVLDPAEAVRENAATELIPRKDDRIVTTLREALGNEEEFVLRNAARTLGTLKAGPAVEDLVAILSTETRRRVVVTRPVYLGDIYSTFGGYHRVVHGRRLLRYRPQSIGCLGPGTYVGTDARIETRTVSVYRTEVQEALIAITGQNLGFDRQAWLQWWRRQQSQP